MVLQHWINTANGQASAEDVAGGNLLGYAVCKPLAVKDRLGDLAAIRHPMNGNEDGSIAIGNNLGRHSCDPDGSQR